MSAQSDYSANISTSESAVSGAFGVGMDYFQANSEERRRIAANATTLEEDEWKTLSDRMVEVYRRNLNVISDIRNAGLTRSISLATMVDTWQKRTEFTAADISVDGESTSDEDRITYSTVGVPVPIVHKDFRISDRELMESRNMGNDLRTEGVAEATRAVTELLEELVIDGWNTEVPDHNDDTWNLYGLRTHPDRNTVSANDWGTSSNIRDSFVAALNAMDEDNRTGGNFYTYVAPPQWREFRAAIDPDGDGNMTVRERITNEFDQELGPIRRAEKLPDGEMLMVDMSQDVVELAEAEDTQVIEWQSGSGMTNYLKVMASLAPEIKSDAHGQSGIVQVTGI